MALPTGYPPHFQKLPYVGLLVGRIAGLGLVSSQALAVCLEGEVPGFYTIARIPVGWCAAGVLALCYSRNCTAARSGQEQDCVASWWSPKP